MQAGMGLLDCAQAVKARLILWVINVTAAVTLMPSDTFLFCSQVQSCGQLRMWDRH